MNNAKKYGKTIECEIPENPSGNLETPGDHMKRWAQ